MPGIGGIRMKLKMLAFAALFALAPLPLAAQTPEQTVALILFGHDDNDAKPVLDKSLFKVIQFTDCFYRFDFGNAGGYMEFDFTELEKSTVSTSADGKWFEMSYEGKAFMVNRNSSNDTPKVYDKFDPIALLGIKIPISEGGKIQAAQERFFKTICKPSPK
jgi:hypothetical protein